MNFNTYSTYNGHFSFFQLKWANNEKSAFGRFGDLKWGALSKTSMSTVVRFSANKTSTLATVATIYHAEIACGGLSSCSNKTKENFTLEIQQGWRAWCGNGKPSIAKNAALQRTHDGTQKMFPGSASQIAETRYSIEMELLPYWSKLWKTFLLATLFTGTSSSGS